MYPAVLSPVLRQGSNRNLEVLFRAAAGLSFIVLTALSFPNMLFREGCPAFAWAALVPFFALLEELSFFRRLLWGGFCSFLLFLCLTFWMADVSVSGWLLFAAVLAIGPFFFSAFCALAPRPPFVRIVFWSGLWVLSEALRSMVMGGFTWSLAYSQSFVPQAIWSAAWGGVYLPVWILVFVNAAFYLSFREKRLFWAGWAAGILFLNMGAGMLLLPHTSGQEMLARVVLIQPNISKEEKQSRKLYDENARRHFALTREAARSARPDLVVWPETAFPDDILADSFWRVELERFAANYRLNLLIGSALLDKGRDRNAALLFSRNGKWTESYVKRKLVPFAEYVPAFFSETLDFFWPGFFFGHRFVPGEGRGVLGYVSAEGNWPRRTMFGVVVCSEEAYPALFRDLSLRGAAFAVVMLNDGWFRRKEALLMHAQNAAFRARESGLAVLRAANTGWSVGFDPFGRVAGGLYPQLQSSGWALVSVPARQPLTVYVQYGDIFVWFCAGFVIIAVCLRKSFR